MSAPTSERRHDLPVVTVLIPCYNQAQYVGNAIESVLAQDYPRKRICIVDPASDDHSDLFGLICSYGPVVKHKSSLDGPVKFTGDFDGVEFVFYYSPFQKMGPSEARNTGIKAEWNNTHLFSMLDADDWYLPGKLSKCVSKWMFSPNHIGLVYNDLKIVHSTHTVHEFREPFNRQKLEQECIISNTPLVSKQALQVAGLYDEDLRTCEDWDLWLRITEHFLAVHIAEPLSAYRVTGQNSSDTVSQENWNRNWQRVQQKLSERNAARH